MAALAALLLARAGTARAQELEPRSYSASPTGAQFLNLAYSHSGGSMLFDPTVGITNAHADIDLAALACGRTFGFGSHQALALVAMPYAWGTFTGNVVQRDSSTSRRGIGDLKAKLTVHLIGPPAMPPAEFARAPHAPLIVGVSLAVSAPTGQYFDNRLINIGTNRWAYKPELGVAYNWRRRWYAESYAGMTFFSDNPSFYPGTRKLEQDPLTSVQGHLSYTLARRSWLALDGTWYGGGSTRTNGGPPSTRQSNTRVGVLLAVGLDARQSVKLGYSYGSSIRIGQNFGIVNASYQWLWL